MSSTLMICPTCGGVKVGLSATAAGRRCTCATTRGVSTAVTTAPLSSPGVSGVAKVCSVCGLDVTDKKRMKDSTTGRYWCYDCFIVEQRKKQPGMAMKCPHCHKDFPPLKMVKHQEAYWCEACHDEVVNKKGKKKADPGANGSTKESAAASGETGSRAPIFIGVLVATVVGFILYYMFVLA